MAGRWVITRRALARVEAQLALGDALGGLAEQLRGVEAVPVAGDQQGRGGDAMQPRGGVEHILGGHRDQHVGGVVDALAAPEQPHQGREGAAAGRRRGQGGADGRIRTPRPALPDQLGEPALHLAAVG
jgi:hypothetical protein